MSPPERQNSRQSAVSPSSGTQTPKRKSRAADGRTEPRVKSVLIEPRDNEPPRVSVSVEYTGEAPGMKALKKLTTDVLHDACRAGEYVDLGFREDAKQMRRVQMFECAEKGES